MTRRMAKCRGRGCCLTCRPRRHAATPGEGARGRLAATMPRWAPAACPGREASSSTRDALAMSCGSAPSRGPLLGVVDDLHSGAIALTRGLLAVFFIRMISRRSSDRLPLLPYSMLGCSVDGKARTLAVRQGADTRLHYRAREQRHEVRPAGSARKHRLCQAEVRELHRW